MVDCALCNGFGFRLVYTLRRMRQMPNGGVLKLKPELLSLERYQQLAARLPSSPLLWKPGEEGVLSVASVACECRPVRHKRKRKQPWKPGTGRDPVQREFWWNT